MEAKHIDPREYQALATRTECDQGRALSRIEGFPNAVRLLHAVLGLMGEVGELAGALERWLWYAQPLDKTNVKEELGDCQWYLAEAHNALNLNMLETMRANIAKLRDRYPEKYTDDRAVEENRDRVKEREVVQDGHGFGHTKLRSVDSADLGKRFLDVEVPDAKS